MPVLLIFALIPVACGEENEEDGVGPSARHVELEVVSGHTQIGRAGMELDQSLGVRVIDQTGRPMDGVPVEWSLFGEGGSLSENLIESGSSGLASVEWTLGTSLGDQVARAVIPGEVSVLFTAEARIGRISVITLSPDSTILLLGETVKLDLVLTDIHGNQATDGPVVWTAADPNIASVDSMGRVIGLKDGGTSITAEIDDKDASVSVAVREVALLSVDVGQNHACGITVNGETWCWGDDRWGQLGDRQSDDSEACLPSYACSDKPVRVATDVTFDVVKSGGRTTCALDSAGVPYCWGNMFGSRNADNPQQITTNIQFASISVGSSHACGLTTAGEAYCWGHDNNGQLGSGTTGAQAEPVPVSGMLNFSMLSAGGLDRRSGFTCGVTTDGEAYCWGRGSSGQLGNGADSTAGSPVPVSGGHLFETVAAGGQHACGISSDGSTYCWGNNTYGQLGSGAGAGSSNTPQSVSTGIEFNRIAAGDHYSCGLTTAGDLYCWGRNLFGQFGNSTTEGAAMPVRGAAGFSFSTIAAGAAHSCAVDLEGRVWCWGHGGVGELGNGASENRSEPVLVLGQP